MTPQQALPIVKALADGDTVQERLLTTEPWCDVKHAIEVSFRLDSGEPRFDTNSIRVKPKPRQWFAVINCVGGYRIASLFDTSGAARDHASTHGGEVIIMEEKL